MRLQPGESGRQLEQQRDQLPDGEPQQQQPGQQEQQPGVPFRPALSSTRLPEGGGADPAAIPSRGPGRLRANTTTPLGASRPGCPWAKAPGGFHFWRGEASKRHANTPSQRPAQERLQLITGRVERRRDDLDQWLPLCLPFRASWQMAIKSCRRCLHPLGSASVVRAEAQQRENEGQPKGETRTESRRTTARLPELRGQRNALDAWNDPRRPNETVGPWNYEG